MSVESWSSFHNPYNETEVKKYAPTSGGVYTLWVNFKSGNWKCYYVGKADNLEQRLLDHHGDSEPNECIKANNGYKRGFSWIPITTQEERSGAEKYLYDKLHPECNQKDPGGSPRPIPMPPQPAPTDPAS